MAKQELLVRYAREEDHNLLTDFRIREFKTSKQFEIVNYNLLAEKRGRIFIVEHNGEIISTMQVEQPNPINFKSICHTEIENDYTLFETFYLSKAATKKAYRDIGLNSLLRKLILEVALKNANVKTLTGIGYENAPRLQLLLKLGYEIRETRLLDQLFLIPIGKVLFLRLNRKNFKKALSIIEGETKKLYERFNIDDQTRNKPCSF